ALNTRCSPGIEGMKMFSASGPMPEMATRMNSPGRRGTSGVKSVGSEESERKTEGRRWVRSTRRSIAGWIIPRLHGTQDILPHLAALAGDRGGEGIQLAPCLVELVEQREDDRHTLLLDLPVVSQRAVQADPGALHLAVMESAAFVQGRDPRLLHPSLQILPVQRPDRGEQLVDPHHRSISRRGFLWSFGVQLSRKRASSGSSPSGSTTFSFTYWWPIWPLRLSLMPCPRRRSVSPVLEFFGIVMDTTPRTVGTSILAPSTASFRVTGTVTCTLLSLRSKKACGWTCTSI